MSYNHVAIKMLENMFILSMKVKSMKRDLPRRNGCSTTNISLSQTCGCNLSKLIALNGLLERENIRVINGKIKNVDEIIIDANMDLQWPHRLSLMPPSPTCSALDPLLSGFEIWTLYRVGLCLEAPCTQLTRSL